jgi:hypothetical protein
MVICLPQIESQKVAMGKDFEPYVLDPTVYSPAIAVTVWSATIDFSLSPTKVYFGDVITFSGKLTETDGATVRPVAGVPMDILISNAAVEAVVIAHTDYTCTDGTFTLYWAAAAPNAIVGTNYFYARSSW